MTLGFDVSNYTSALERSSLDACIADGFGLVIVQAIDPPAGYPVGVTRAQIQACLDAGLVVDVYVWLWFDLDVADIQHKLSLLDGLNVRRLWLDIEDVAAVKYDQATTEAKIADALAACDGFATTSGVQAGVYTGRWFWTDPRYAANTTSFADRALWDANYDGIADATQGFVPYGGWSGCAIKQHRGTTTLHGISGVDLNALSESEVASLTQPTAPAAPDCASYKAAIDRAEQRLGIELAKKTPLSRSLIREIQSELFQALQG